MAVDMRAFLTGLSSGGVSIEKSNTLSAPPEKSATYPRADSPHAPGNPALVGIPRRSHGDGGGLRPVGAIAASALSRAGPRSVRWLGTPARCLRPAWLGTAKPARGGPVVGAVRLRQPTQDARGVPVWRHRRNGPPDYARLRCGGVGRYSGPRQGEASTRAPTGLRRDVKLGKAELRKRARFCGSNKKQKQIA